MKWFLFLLFLLKFATEVRSALSPPILMVRFNFTGAAQTYTIPPDYHYLSIKAYGAGSPDQVSEIPREEEGVLSLKRLFRCPADQSYLYMSGARVEDQKPVQKVTEPPEAGMAEGQDRPTAGADTCLLTLSRLM